MVRDSAKKFSTVISRNTFWFHNKQFEEKYEADITAIRETLLVLRNQVQKGGLTKKLLTDLIAEKKMGYGQS